MLEQRKNKMRLPAILTQPRTQVGVSSPQPALMKPWSLLMIVLTIGVLPAQSRAPIGHLLLSSNSKIKNGGGGGSRTPVRKALRPEAYMLIAFDLVRRLR
jgi:hypothetical protein